MSGCTCFADAAGLLPVPLDTQAPGRLSELSRRCCIQCAGAMPAGGQTLGNMAHRPVCRHFLRDRCKYGVFCRFRHELTPVRFCYSATPAAFKIPQCIVPLAAASGCICKSDCREHVQQAPLPEDLCPYPAIQLTDAAAHSVCVCVHAQNRAAGNQGCIRIRSECWGLLSVLD